MDNTKELLLKRQKDKVISFFSSDGEAPASLHKVQVIETFLRMLKYLNPNWYCYSWWYYNICTQREPRKKNRHRSSQRRRGKMSPTGGRELTKIDHRTPTNIFLDMKQTMIKNASKRWKKSGVKKQQPFVSGTRCNPWPSGSHAGSCRRGDQKVLQRLNRKSLGFAKVLPKIPKFCRGFTENP